jgi:hypothetical protein
MQIITQTETESSAVQSDPLPSRVEPSLTRETRLF